MTAIEKFTLLHATLKDIFKDFVDNIMKVSASLIIAIGWILTSTSAKDFLTAQGKQGSSTFFLVLAAVVVIAIIHSIVSFGFYQRSQKIMRMLSKLNVVEEDGYDNYRISWLHLTVSLMVNLFLFAILFTMILVLKDI